MSARLRKFMQPVWTMRSDPCACTRSMFRVNQSIKIHSSKLNAHGNSLYGCFASTAVQNTVNLVHIGFVIHYEFIDFYPCVRLERH
jgi:hypothetical protein